MQSLETLDTLHYSLRGPASGNTSLPDVDSSRFAGCTSGARTVQSLWGFLGASWEPLGSLLGASLGLFGASLGPFGAPWGRPGPSWGALTPSGPFGGHLGGLSRPPWGSLGVLLGRFGSLLDRLGGLFWPSRGPLGPSWGPLGGLLGRLGAFLEAAWAVMAF